MGSQLDDLFKLFARLKRVRCPPPQVNLPLMAMYNKQKDSKRENGTAKVTDCVHVFFCAHSILRDPRVEIVAHSFLAEERCSLCKCFFACKLSACHQTRCYLR